MYKDTYNAQFFGSVVIGIATELKDNIWSFTKRERLAAIDKFLTDISRTYNVPKPQFRFVEGNEGNALYSATGGGCLKGDINPETGEVTYTIEMYRKFSLTTLLHEYRHYMQRVGLVEGLDVPGFDIEEDAREWSCSLYYVVDPVRYMKAVQLGKLRYA